MNTLRTKLSSALHLSPSPSATPPNPTLTPSAPTSLDIHRYRAHHGTNLGSVFVLEKWLFPSLFPPNGGAKGDSELDAVAASVEAHGIEATRRRWERHWSCALSDGEIEWLAVEAGVTSLRVPVGYFTLGERGCRGTPFAPYAAVYRNAWATVLSLCERLDRIGGVGVLLDLHALPGGANDQDHSGTSSHCAELWGSDGFLGLARECAVFLAREVREGRVAACTGVQIVNEACWGAGRKGMWNWAEGVVEAVGGVDESLPIYVSDAWDTREALARCSRMNRVAGKGTVGVACSKYFCFSEDDRGKSPKEIIEQIEQRELGEVKAKGNDVMGEGAKQVFVTEWSCALDPSTKEKAPESEREELIKRFGLVQGERWRERAGGTWFWTAKMDWMDGGKWGFFEMVKRGAVVPAANLKLSFEDVKKRVKNAKAGKQERKRENVHGHVAYWTKTSPKTKFEHWRFEQGWDLGFADAMAFFEARSSGIMSGARSGGDKIGALELWILKRLRECGAEWWGEFAWEWEHGFRQGVISFESLVLEGV